jgi:hypothetical protein
MGLDRVGPVAHPAAPPAPGVCPVQLALGTMTARPCNVPPTIDR